MRRTFDNLVLDNVLVATEFLEFNVFVFECGRLQLALIAQAAPVVRPASVLPYTAVHAGARLGAVLLQCSRVRRAGCSGHGDVG